MYIQELFESDAHIPLLNDLEELVVAADGHFELISHKPLRFEAYARPEAVEELAAKLVEKGCKRLHSTELVTLPEPKDGVLPDDIHSTSN